MSLLRVIVVELAVLVPLGLETQLREVRPARVCKSGGGKSVNTKTITKREPNETKR